jgi:hypothetical protein
MKKQIVAVIIMLVLFGCSPTRSAKMISSDSVTAVRTTETPAEVNSALKAVVGSVTKADIGDQELKELAQKMRADEEASSAVEAVTGALTGQGAKFKYCPVTGERYSPQLEFCPKHPNVRLKYVGE